MGSTGRRVDHKGVDVERGQGPGAHTQQKLSQVPPLRPSGLDLLFLCQRLSLFTIEAIGLSVIVLTPVAAVNETIQKLNSSQLTEKLNAAGLTSVEDRLCNRYLRHFISSMDHKIRVGPNIL